MCLQGSKARMKLSHSQLDITVRTVLDGSVVSRFSLLLMVSSVVSCFPFGLLPILAVTALAIAFVISPACVFWRPKSGRLVLQQLKQAMPPPKAGSSSLSELHEPHARKGTSTNKARTCSSGADPYEWCASYTLRQLEFQAPKTATGNRL